MFVQGSKSEWFTVNLFSKSFKTILDTFSKDACFFNKNNNEFSGWITTDLSSREQATATRSVEGLIHSWASRTCPWLSHEKQIPRPAPRAPTWAQSPPKTPAMPPVRFLTWLQLTPKNKSGWATGRDKRKEVGEERREVEWSIHTREGTKRYKCTEFTRRRKLAQDRLKLLRRTEGLQQGRTLAGDLTDVLAKTATLMDHLQWSFFQN